MFAINATVCEGSDTDATVSLEFSTTGATCSTEDLRHEGHKTWFRYGGKHLGNCKSFRPIDGLQAKIWGVDAPADQLKFCKLTVNFGNFWKFLGGFGGKKEGSEKWEWTGETTVFRDNEKWLKLVKVDHLG